MNFDCFTFTGKEIASLMRKHRLTIRGLKAKTGFTMKRIREIRNSGIKGHAACDWFEAITGSLSPRMKAAYLQLAKGNQ